MPRTTRNTTRHTTVQASLEVYSFERFDAGLIAILDRKRENTGS